MTKEIDTLSSPLIGIQIDNFFAADDSCQMQLSTNGHCGVEEFAAACEKFLVEWDERRVVVNRDKIRHTYRTTREPEDHETLVGEGEYVFTETDEKHGVPVTVYDPWLPIHSH